MLMQFSMTLQINLLQHLAGNKMFEIELKAHVKDKNALKEKLNSFAVYKNSLVRDDQYFSKDKIKVRLRKESNLTDKTDTFILTYKQKETLSDTEVNDEKECTLSSPDAFLSFINDAGFKIELTKHKEVESWTYLGATIELCNVPPLGDFIEIEILSSSNDTKIVETAQQKLHDILKMCDIPLSEIENRYYSQMLKDI